MAFFLVLVLLGAARDLLAAKRRRTLDSDRESGFIKPYIPPPGMVIKGFGGRMPFPRSRGILQPGKAPEVYIVQPGETLSIICDRILGDRDYWPKLWALNPHISNPHWIYPGTQIRFYPSSDAGPPYLEIVPERDILPASLSIVGSDDLFREEVDGLELTDDDELSVISVEDLDDVSTEIFTMAGSEYSGSSLKFVLPGFIAEKEIESRGEIVLADTEQTMFSEHDIVWVKLSKDIEEGEAKNYIGTRFTVIGDTDESISRDTPDGSVAGDVVRYKGVLEIINADRKFLKARVIASYQAMAVGDVFVDYLPIAIKLDNIASESGPKVEGKILAYAVQNRTYIGERALVFIGLGLKDGVASGNVYSIFEYLEDDEDLPRRKLGTVKLAEVFEYFSSAIIVESKREIRVGSHILHDPFVAYANFGVPGDDNEDDDNEDDDNEDDDNEDDDNEDDDNEDDDNEDDDNEDDDNEDDDNEDDDNEDDDNEDEGED